MRLKFCIVVDPDVSEGLEAMYGRANLVIKFKRSFVNWLVVEPDGQGPATNLRPKTYFKVSASQPTLIHDYDGE